MAQASATSTHLPSDIKARLAELDLEFSEGESNVVDATERLQFGDFSRSSLFIHSFQSLTVSLPDASVSVRQCQWHRVIYFGHIANIHFSIAGPSGGPFWCLIVKAKSCISDFRVFLTIFFILSKIKRTSRYSRIFFPRRPRG